MSPRVSLSLKAARSILEEHACESAPLDWVVEEIEAAIAKATRASATRRKLKQPKAEKRASKQQERAHVRAAVMARASSLCEAEACREWSGHLQLDHFFGKARAESLETCWALCPRCHREKTDNRPSAAGWLVEFMRHAEAHGYHAARARAEKRLQWVESKAVRHG